LDRDIDMKNGLISDLLVELSMILLLTPLVSTIRNSRWRISSNLAWMPKKG